MREVKWDKLFESLYADLKRCINDYPQTDIANVFKSAVTKCGFDVNDLDALPLSQEECRKLVLIPYYDFLAAAEVDAKAERWEEVDAEDEIIGIFNWWLSEYHANRYTSPKLSLDEYEEKLKQFELE